MPDTVYPANRKKFPTVLAFDTSGPFVCVGAKADGYLDGFGILRDMPKGQAETLFPIIEEVMDAGSWHWPDVDAIGVAVGPGNFTGIRIGVSAARGLGLALGIPVFGLSQFELAYGSLPIANGTLISVPAPRDIAYVQGFGIGGQAGQARMIDPGAPPRDLQLPSGMQVLGHRATEIAHHFEATGRDEIFRPDPGKMAEMVETKYIQADAFPPRPAPNYVKPPDAAPARDLPPKILT